jgi:Fe-S oxidoreductase
MGPVVMTLLLVVSWGIFAYSAVRRWRLMMVARAPDNRFDRIGDRIKSVLLYMCAQRRMPRYPLAGWAHIAVFFGFVVLLLNSLILWGRGFFGPHFAFGLFSLHQPLGLIYAFVRDIFTVLVIAGVLVFYWNRVVVRLGRLTLNAEGVLILTIIFVMMIADLVYEGTYVNRFEGGAFMAAVPFGSLTGRILSPLSDGAQTGLMHAGFWMHSALVLLFLNLLPYGKHFHVVTVMPNVFFRRLGPSGRVRPIVDIEGRLEREETLGAKRIQDFSWKAALDLYTCTECGRCSDQCPATRTGKLLSPKHFCIALRDHMYLREDQLIGPHFYVASAPRGRRGTQEGTAGADTSADANVGSADPTYEPYTGDPPGRPHGTRDRHGLAHDPDAQAILHTEDLTPAWISPEVLWACTTCGACEQECPVFITYIDKIVDLRRHLVMERGEFPEQLQQTFKGLETVGNPYSFSPEQRAEWAEGLNIPLRAEKPEAEWLFWVGCAPSFDDRSRKIARATAELLQEAGLDFAILGPEEQCNGDPARRAGNEYLFQMLAQANIETLNRYNVKKIVTTCPHCYHTLKNEYPDFGGHYELFHHTELLAQLVRQGKLRPRFPVKATIAYHDACYLGRHNDVYGAPREIISHIPGAFVAEPAESRDRGMCCGAGGAQMWKEEEHGDARVNHTRVKQLLRVLPNGGTTPSTDGTKPTIATACPFCMTMLTDGCRDQGFDDVQQLDVAEILHRAVKGPKEAQNTAQASAAQPA